MMALFNCPICLLTSYVLIVSVTKRFMLKSPIIITGLSIFLLNTGNFSFMYLAALLFGAYAIKLLGHLGDLTLIIT